jgi:hypothetical protein
MAQSFQKTLGAKKRPDNLPGLSYIYSWFLEFNNSQTNTERI